MIESGTCSSPEQQSSSRSSFVRGAIEMLPLCVSVIPWGILAGSMAIQAGLTFWQSVGMSAIVFAGAAQLVTLGMIMTGANLFAILLSVFFITSQHFIYGLTLREFVSHLKIKLRLPIGFLLTDELFALSETKNKRSELTPSYLIGAGLTFYLSWNVFSLMGIVMASSVPDLDKYHLDYSIVATFVTIVVPMVKKISTLIGVVVSLLLAMLLSYWQLEGAIVISGLCGMFSAVLASVLLNEEHS
ncbi:AzlC family ABC transporter permease [Aeromonas sp.]|uniref:AzlC family ABC transporter permease n=1 Tax=Aeromonas sp. TaxID=647 RepID=UPI00258737DA|nr:AzlC family ABC transporter permease [Aeromonas sp.]MCX7132591.1 AzlC family ABC transporter permease [Aeromonas sp.]